MIRTVAICVLVLTVDSITFPVLFLSLILIVFCGIGCTLVGSVFAFCVILPVYLILSLFVWPLFIFCWCIIHINFKVSLFATPTRWLYKAMQAGDLCTSTSPKAGDYPKERHRQINLSFLSEIVGESLPQLIIVQINEAFTHYSKGFWVSALEIVNLVPIY